MYVHKYVARDRLWTVGYFDPQGQWHALFDCDSSDAAIELIHYLNGGERPPVAVDDDDADPESGLDLGRIPPKNVR